VGRPPDVSKGIPEGDDGWTGAARYVFANGTADYHGAFQANFSPTMLYMSFETHNDSGLDKQDAVTVLFSIPGGNPKYHAILIWPTTSNAPTIGSPVSITGNLFQHYTANLTADGTEASLVQWNFSNNVPLTNASAYYYTIGSGTAYSWYVEVQIPLGSLVSLCLRIQISDSMRTSCAQTRPTKPCFPSSGRRNPTPIAGPYNTALKDATGYPAPNTWGKASLGGLVGCGGVYFGQDPNDIWVNAPRGTR